MQATAYTLWWPIEPRPVHVGKRKINFIPGCSATIAQTFCWALVVQLIV